MNDTLGKLTFCTFNTGATMVREVLDDWEEFLGGRPAGVIFVVAATDGTIPPVYEELLAEGRIDHLIRLESAGRNAGDMNAEAVYDSVRAATTEWVLTAKLDTLPYRSGHGRWLAEVMDAIEGGGYLGITSTFSNDLVVPAPAGYCAIQECTENFAIVRRADWLEAVESRVGRDRSAMRGVPQGHDARFVNEHALRDWMESQGRWMLMKTESRDWSIFHVNVWGERLRQVRESYRARKGVDKFLNLKAPTDKRICSPWELYYGEVAPPWPKRARIVLGRWRRQLLGRGC